MPKPRPSPVPPTTSTTNPFDNTGSTGGNSIRPGSAFTKGDTGYLGPPIKAGGSVGAGKPASTPPPVVGASTALGGGTLTGRAKVKADRKANRTRGAGGLSHRQGVKQIRRNKHMGLKAVPNTAPALTKPDEKVY